MSKQRITVREVEEDEEIINSKKNLKRNKKVNGFFDIVVDAINLYDNTIVADELYNSDKHTGGKIRIQNGKLVETMISNILNSLCIRHNIKNYEIKIGKKGGIKVESEHGFINAFVDVHLFIDNKLVIACECKSYLDDAFMTRADSVFNQFRKSDENTKRVLISLEDYIAKSSLMYFIDQQNVNDVFFLIDGKRNYKNPIWLKDTYKSINNIKMVTLVTYFDEIISKFK